MTNRLHNEGYEAMNLGYETLALTHALKSSTHIKWESRM